MKIIFCAVCGKKTNLKVMYGATFNPKHLNRSLYISRRIPDHIHFQIVRCLNCGLTFSNPICDKAKIEKLYKECDVPLMEDLENSSEVYIKYLKQILPGIPKKERFLDIGCGNGFFLEHVRKIGFKEVWGIEPSINAVKHLSKGLDKKRIISGIFQKKYFKSNYFNAISSFHVLDHATDPNKFLKDCFYILKPGGYIMAIMHDAKALTHQILGEKSPIFDIQHIYLFDKKTIRQIFINNGFEIELISTIYSNYTLGYWLKMAPIPNSVKKLISRFDSSTLFKRKISFPAGNMLIVAKKPIRK